VSKNVVLLPVVTLHFAVDDNGKQVRLNPLPVQMPPGGFSELAVASEQIRAELQQQVDATEKSKSLFNRVKNYFKRK